MSQIHIIPTLEDNYTYVIEADNKAILVDCGEAAPVIAFLKEKSLQPTDILITHHHWDHIDGLPALKTAYPDIKIYGPEKDHDRIPQLETGLTDTQKFQIGDFSIECIETPGHTKNHLCFYLPELNATFTGDALFSMGCGQLFEGTYDDLFFSMQKLKSLPDSTQIYCGHEYTLTNARFSLSVEPDNQDILNRKAEVETLRQKNLPTLPVSLANERKTNLFLKTATVEKIAQLRQLRDKF